MPITLTPSRDVAVTVAERAGYITLKADGNDFWRIELTEKGRSLLARQYEMFNREPYGLETGNGCDSYQVDLPLREPSL
jgi:hypothetical protein